MAAGTVSLSQARFFQVYALGRIFTNSR